MHLLWETEWKDYFFRWEIDETSHPLFKFLYTKDRSEEGFQKSIALLKTSEYWEHMDVNSLWGELLKMQDTFHNSITTLNHSILKNARRVLPFLNLKRKTILIQLNWVSENICDTIINADNILIRLNFPWMLVDGINVRSIIHELIHHLPELKKIQDHEVRHYNKYFARFRKSDQLFSKLIGSTEQKFIGRSITNLIDDIFVEWNNAIILSGFDESDMNSSHSTCEFLINRLRELTGPLSMIFSNAVCHDYVYGSAMRYYTTKWDQFKHFEIDWEQIVEDIPTLAKPFSEKLILSEDKGQMESYLKKLSLDILNFHKQFKMIITQYPEKSKRTAEGLTFDFWTLNEEALLKIAQMIRSCYEKFYYWISLDEKYSKGKNCPDCSKFVEPECSGCPRCGASMA
ncbi:MAG: hypothetical protein ABIH34_05980 [Nanoarchaeota archaeon]